MNAALAHGPYGIKRRAVAALNVTEPERHASPMTLRLPALAQVRRPAFLQSIFLNDEPGPLPLIMVEFSNTRIGDIRTSIPDGKHSGRWVLPTKTCRRTCNAQGLNKAAQQIGFGTCSANALITDELICRSDRLQPRCSSVLTGSGLEQLSSSCVRFFEPRAEGTVPVLRHQNSGDQSMTRFYAAWATMAVISMGVVGCTYPNGHYAAQQSGYYPPVQQPGYYPPGQPGYYPPTQAGYYVPTERPGYYGYSQPTNAGIRPQPTAYAPAITSEYNPQPSAPENCGTPSEPKSCPPMPRVPLTYFPGDR